ncbi:BolA/IbaG family iron-sulfur metabolism protein [Neptunomonas sp.]|uniref:BolA family protein n=1 Tax=Neptunomonas sp. TaxID=1971898 RepID=UPI0025D4056B|nr:BolA/IbaG family iron-sulfur metabolism protein [Neptunomonas sp.]
MSIAIVVEEKLRADINVIELQILNESHMHSGPATDSHFKLVLVSDDFAEKRLVQRHQMIYKTLAQELQSPIHALSMHLYTQDEWTKKNGEVMPSPACKGASKS